jgi:hypothetical protein
MAFVHHNEAAEEIYTDQRVGDRKADNRRGIRNQPLF